jgi:hypothetical protein
MLLIAAQLIGGDQQAPEDAYWRSQSASGRSVARNVNTGIAAA